MTRELIHSATLMTVDPQDRVVEDGWLVIEDGRIAELGPASSRPGSAGFDRVTDLSGHLPVGRPGDDQRLRAHELGR